MAQEKQVQAIKEHRYETTEKIRHLEKKVSITDILKPTSFLRSIEKLPSIVQINSPKFSSIIALVPVNQLLLLLSSC